MYDAPLHNPQESVGGGAPQLPPPSFWRQHWHKLTALTIWLLLLSGYIWYSVQYQQGPLDMAQHLVLLLNTVYGPLIFILAFVMRPLVFFSAALLTIVAGSIFGPFWGLVYTLIGSNLSAALVYLLGWFFGSDLLASTTREGRLQRYCERLRQNCFRTVLVLNLIFLPFDLIGYTTGMLRAGFRSFLGATMIGSLPGIISCVLLGASVQIEVEEEFMWPSIHPGALTLSIFFFVVGLLLARYMRSCEDC